MEFATSLCEDIVMGLFVLQKDSNIYFE